MLRKWDSLPFGECWLEIRKLKGLRPIVLVRSSLNLENLENLVDFWISSEKSFSLSHLSENATNGPNINRCWVLFLTEKNFRSSVPKGNYFMSISFHWETKGSCETEISKLNVAVLINQEILRLKISVHNSVSVAISSSLQNLISETLNFLRRKWPTNLSHIFLEIVFTILKYQVEFVLWVQYFLQSSSYYRFNLTLRYLGVWDL